MENINGALAFEATLDIDDFNVSSQAMERRIRQVSTTAQVESEQMDESLLKFAKNGAMYITTYLVGQGMTNMLNSIVQTRGQFQQLEIAFGTMLGSGERAKELMDQMAETAAKTPFDLKGVAGGAKQLLAYGVSADKVNDTLVRLGNIASGLSIPLNDIVYLYGTTMVQGRLYAQDVRQFTGRGIPLVKELAAAYGVTAEEINKMVSEGKIGFADVEKVINKLTNSGGQFFNLMEKQSASLTGMISNLQDSWDMMLNEIGEANQDVFAKGISGATYMVEHYESILKVLKAIAIAYGTYRAAVVLNTLATKGHTGVALLDNTAAQAKIALLKMEATLSSRSAAQTQAMTAATMAHVAALQNELSAEELANIQKRLRVATIQGLLTAQQQEYLSNLGLTASSEGYEAAAMGVMSVEQQMALKKTDLSSKSAAYRTMLEQETNAKRMNAAATLEAMRAEVKEAYAKMESAKQTAISASQATEAARYEVYWAKQSGDATRIATAEKRLEAAVNNEAITRKTALAASTEFYTKKKTLETTATKQSTAAAGADIAAKETQTAVTGLLSSATGKLTASVKVLWATMKANPLGWLLTIVGLVISAFTLFRKEQEDASDAMGEFQDTTKKEIDNLEMLFAVLRTTENGTQTNTKVVEKINAICKEYNKTLLDENATLDDQRKKYEELAEAIQQTTAEKIRAKYTEQALQEQAKGNDEAKGSLKKTARKFQTYEMPDYAEYGYWADVESIQTASDALFDLVESDAMEAANRLKTLSGKTYTEAYRDAVDAIVKSFQAATKTSDDNMADFRRHIETYFDSVVQNAKKADQALASVNTALEAYRKKEPPKTAQETAISAAMSFDELEKKAKDAQTEIDEINAKEVKVDADTTRLENLQTLLGDINGAINTKTNGLNTEAGITSRIQQLKNERANVEINSKRYKELSETIESLEKKMPSNKSNTTAAQNAATLTAKQIENERKLGEARIAVMEEGYAKRKAALDLQHRLELAQIDKEQKELEEAYKKAGKGSLSEDDKAAFQERRDLAEQSYSKESVMLFDSEIEYRKKQYAAYYQWVENVGKDVADKHFQELLKEGGSFTAWVNTQIANLEAKRAESPAEFSGGDASALNALKIQQSELTGAKSAMDLFRESVQRTVGQAQNLAEKLQAVADLKERLANGDFHLNNDDTAAATLQLDTQDSELQREVQDTLLNEYRTYEEQKKAIQDEYALLRNEAIKANNQERLDLVNQGEAEALSALNAAMLMQSESWKNLFSDMDSLTVEQIDKLVRDIQEKLNTADLNLNPADLAAVLDKLDQAKQKVLDVNPFKALGSAISSVFSKSEKGSKKSSKQIKTDWSNLANATAGCFGFIEDAIDSCDVLGDLIGDTGKATISMLGGIAQSGIAMAAAIKTAEKGSVVLLAISIALQAIQWIASLFNNDDKIEERIQNIQRNIDRLEGAFGRLQNAYNNTYWTFNEEEQAAYEKNVQSIEAQIKALQKEAEAAASVWNFGRYAKLVKQIKELNYELEKAKNKGDMFALYELQKENLRKQQELIKQQIEAEKSKKKTDWDKINSWEEQIKDIDTQVEDLERSMMETLAGTDVKTAIDDFAEALVDAYCQGEDAAEALGEKTKAVLKNAVVEALKRQFLAKGINDAVEYLADAMGDQVLTDAERAKFTAMVNAAGNLFNEALENVGDWIKDTEDAAQDPLQGAVTSMSEETGGVIAGRLNAFIINQGDQTAIMREALVYQAQIATNTANIAQEITEVKYTLKRIETKDNSLLSQGVS